MFKVASAFLFSVLTCVMSFVLSGCASGTPPQTYSICSTQPGSYACQVDQYKNVND